jgi:hypothetical protein
VPALPAGGMQGGHGFNLSIYVNFLKKQCVGMTADVFFHLPEALPMLFL